MRIKKTYNNNIALVSDDKNLEHIIIGKGVSFQKKKGDIIDLNKIEKDFVLTSEQTMNSFVQLFNEVPVNHLELTTKIITMAEKELNTQFDNSIYIGLTDHLNYALERHRKNQHLKNAILWEIKRFHAKEFDLAKKAKEIIYYEENVLFDDDELGYIALHFVNAQQDEEGMEQTILMTEIMQEIMKLVKYFYKIEIDELSLNYGRFITHIRFFIKRIFNHDVQQNTEEDIIMYQQVANTYPKSAECVDVISNYIEKKFDIIVQKDEKLYLILHIQRITK